MYIYSVKCYERTDERTDKRTDEQTNERTNGQTDSLLELAGFYPPAKNPPGTKKFAARV